MARESNPSVLEVLRKWHDLVQKAHPPGSGAKVRRLSIEFPGQLPEGQVEVVVRMGTGKKRV